MDKTKKKIRNIGKVSYIILTIVMIIMLIVAFGSSVAGVTALISDNLVSQDTALEFIDGIFRDSDITIPEDNSLPDEQQIRSDLMEMLDNIKGNGLIRSFIDEDSEYNINIMTLISLVFFSVSFFCLLMSLYVNMIRSMMKTMSSGEKPFTIKAAKKLRRLSLVILLIILINPLTALIMFVITLMFSYLFEYGAYLQDKADETNRIQEEMIMSFAEITENKSEQTGKHVRRVAEYSRIIAEGMGLSEDQTSNIRLASTMHDIGKLLIPAEILEKPARLTDEEFATIKKHPGYGGKLLNNVEGEVMHLARTIALDHHERVDGKGYPEGKKEESISLEGRIVAVADVYDALTSKRSYKEPWDHQKAYDEIVKGSGTQFDPRVVEAFTACYGKINEMRQKYADEA